MYLYERKGDHEYDLKTLMQYNQHHMDFVEDILLIEIPSLGESVVSKTHVSIQFANPFFSTPRYKYVLYKYICNIKWAIWGHCVCEKGWMFEVRIVGM